MSIFLYYKPYLEKLSTKGRGQKCPKKRVFKENFVGRFFAEIALANFPVKDFPKFKKK